MAARRKIFHKRFARVSPVFLYEISLRLPTGSAETS